MATLYDRLKAALTQLVEQLLARTDYHALYPCTVTTQNDDGTVDLACPQRFGPGLQGVRVRGLPGVAVRVKQGAQVLLGWEGGDPTQRFCALAAADSLESLTILADVSLTLTAPMILVGKEGGVGKPVATVGSLVEFTAMIPPTPVPIPITGLGYVTEGVATVLAAGG